MNWIAWAIVVLVIAVWLFDKMVSVKKQSTEMSEIGEHQEKDYSKSYQAKYLLTRNEWHEYKKLQRLAAERGLVICPKVRLLDIIEPRKGETNYKSLLYKVQAKHVDFLICDQDMHIKAILELDDNSHNKKDRQTRDAFVDQILTSVGYQVIRTYAIKENTLDDINEVTESLTFRSQAPHPASEDADI